MRPDIRRAVDSVATRGWPRISLEFGRDALEISVPPGCEILSMKDAAVLPDPAEAVEKALSSPLGCPPLKELIRIKGKSASEITAAVTVSDITRPVPYKGGSGMLGPLLTRLESSGIPRSRITIVVGTGTHRASTAAEKIEMFGETVARDYRIIDHDCEKREALTYLGKTAGGTPVYVNSLFFGADIKIVTGLVESHFMAGVSGGRKGVCPALVDKRTIEKFHSPAFLESSFADNLVLDGNPCHAEALDVARMAGVDFLVNATLDKDLHPTGIFAGHLEDAHLAAFKFMKDYTVIPLQRAYDIVLTHGGFAGRNHYQSAKAGCAALPAVRPAGMVIIAADNRDPDPIGGPDYRRLIGRLKSLGAEGYIDLITNPSWRFTQDQWQPEVWARVLRKIGEEGLVYCGPQIPIEDYAFLPGRSGFDFVPEAAPRSARDTAEAMVQNALLCAMARSRQRGVEPAVAVLREGPYGIPRFE